MIAILKYLTTRAFILWLQCYDQLVKNDYLPHWYLVSLHYTTFSFLCFGSSGNFIYMTSSTHHVLVFSLTSKLC